MSNIFRYNKFQVYGESLNLSRKVRKLAFTLPRTEDYSLKSQMTRAADSVVLNIAEGVDRYTNKDFGRFLNQAIASLSETGSCLDICVTNGYISKTDYDALTSEAQILYKKLNALHSRIVKST